MYVYPVETTVVMKNLRKKVTQLEASYSVNAERGKIRDPELEAAISDAEELRDKLQVGAEKILPLWPLTSQFGPTHLKN